MGILREVGNFFEHGKRYHKLSEVINVIQQFKWKLLKSFCRTEWVKRHTTWKHLGKSSQPMQPSKSLRDISLKEGAVQRNRKALFSDTRIILGVLVIGYNVLNCMSLVIDYNILSNVKVVAVASHELLLSCCHVKFLGTYQQAISGQHHSETPNF